jgi:hypothetical protein
VSWETLLTGSRTAKVVAAVVALVAVVVMAAVVTRPDAIDVMPDGR